MSSPSGLGLPGGLGADAAVAGLFTWGEGVCLERRQFLL